LAKYGGSTPLKIQTTMTGMLCLTTSRTYGTTALLIVPLGHENGVVGYPIAASPDGYLYYHEFGFNDGSTVPETALNAFIESSGIELGDGDSFMFANRLIPDLTFRNSTATSPVATFTLKARNFPGGTFLQSGNENVTSTSVSPIQLYTDQVFIRIRGRSVAMRIESDQLNTAWRLGAPRIDVRPDGRR
jgi:hypothetical protein